MGVTVGLGVKKELGSTGTRVSLSAVTIKSAVVAALDGLLFGFDTAVIAGATKDLASVYHLTK